MNTPAARPVQGPLGDPSHDRDEGLLRVCVATPLFPPDYSGAAVRFQRYAPGLRKRGVAMHVVAAEVGAWRRKGGYPAWSDKSTKRTAPTVDIQVHRVAMPKARHPGTKATQRRNRTFERAVVGHCREASTRPDVLIWLYSPLVRGVPNLLRIRREGVPMMRAETMFDSGSLPLWKRWLQPVYRPLLYRLMDCLVVGTGAMHDSLRDLGVRTPIEVIPHGVDLTRFRPARDPEERTALRSRLELADDSESVLFVGPLSARKGVLELASAWDRVAEARPKAHLILVGPEQRGSEARDSFAAQVRERFARGHGADRVRFVGPVGDVENYLRAADLFVFPSQREGMPNAVCEAFASGLPTILTPFLGLSDELGRRGREYVLVERTPTQIGDGILRLLGDNERRRSLGAAARRWAEDRLDVEGSLDRLASLCKQVASGRSGVSIS